MKRSSRRSELDALLRVVAPGVAEEFRVITRSPMTRDATGALTRERRANAVGTVGKTLWKTLSTRACARV